MRMKRVVLRSSQVRLMNYISIVTPCFNEEENIEILYQRVKSVFETLETCRYEHIFIDNCSTDNSPDCLRKLAAIDPQVKVIFNSRNFGWIRSPYYGLLQASGDAAIMVTCDLQDPPELIPKFVNKWLEGYQIVIGVKEQSAESSILFLGRKLYYKLVNRLADIPLFENFTGFGLYDKNIIKLLETHEDPYPYFRGLIAEIGFETATIFFTQPQRQRGISSSNFYKLYDAAMLGITSHSKVPLRLATICGFIFSGVSLLAGIGYLIAKLFFWNYFSLGMAPVVVGLFFFASVQLFFIGILGEYIGSIHTKVLKRPLVIEKERINFDQNQASKSDTP